MKKIFVIAPDKSSGDAFNKELVKNGFDTNVYYAKIAPRVIDNKISTDPQVEKDLSEAILVGHNKGFNKIIIACNTLQFWLEKAKALLPSDILNNVEIITTFDTLRQKFKDVDKRPLLIGTTVTVSEIKDFPTLLNTDNGDTQGLVQEIIWRVKGATGSDVTTASKTIDYIDSKEVLNDKTHELFEKLKKLEFKEVVLACTELPIAFEEYKDNPDIKFIDPATLIR